ncbi:hypothetical protein NIES2135_34450 [Leptolyngbya boryana NIES-2135]|jgi:predicted CopG family antitoxin|uniref:Uncharacterized protein n=1 Tax=Leptolyngbya boryana NIES-2135 TaxID=1973484 RepID=A0A1Z4JIN1_LEPBY|nr:MULTISPECIES: hypothetical protein [Leptolyngbya]BAY56611.1 hypothetical protein NIES2135_34450 [Leptolyngbya boryana NIES-2135]MBD2369913.1 hypothetical protein [Leptolyngbya sp. FACHB-161]MBD2376142.1 hypothetical protein [Leptolyngbya sp. FACHB-238]MBD2400417.1 hypothetical protein [Leptolyngbya sp. FACHB-239]MBD2406959.1 hypothetical protein [Leptolyngbya sp. FACHB-402]
MSERLTITVSDRLYQRLQAVKSNINVSQVCQQAIETAVTIEEIKLKEAPIMDKLVERLRIEKQESEGSWKQDGVVDGQEDAAELSYDEFRQLESDGLTEDLREWLNSRRVQYLENPDLPAYLEGWCEGALSVWQQVKGVL